jgi:mono/diheme cytochrome c family protein
MPMIVGILVGIALLLILAFAVSYAAGWSAGGAAADGDAAATLGQERKAQLIIGVLLGTGLILLIYGLSEPSRQAEAFERQRHTSIERGAHAFAQYCYGCHGYTGTGAIVPGQGIQAANLTIRRATGDRDDDKKTYELLTKTIARGRPNTPMPAWGLRDGGSLNDEEISELATFIMYGNWSEVQSLVAAGAPTPDMPEGPSGTGDVLARSLFSAKGCVACHTIQEIPSARGNIGPNLSDLGRVAGTRAPGVSAEDYIRNHILQGSNYQYHAPGFQPLMPPFQGQFTPEQLDAMVEYLSKLGS